MDVRDCDVNGTSAGSSFQVKRMGTAVINTLDDQGRPAQLLMTNTLISAALQLLTAKGCQIHMGKDTQYRTPQWEDSFSGHQGLYHSTIFPQARQLQVLARVFGPLLW